MKNVIKKRSIIGLCLIMLALSFSVKANANNDVRNFNQPKLQWWQQARFGMFIHWGPVTLTGGEISWSRSRYVISKYDSLYLRFNPVKFNADKLVEIAQSAGMKYMVLTVKHHDGFCMWNTKTTDYNIMKTPYGKDVCRQLADAAHKAGMHICWYFSPAEWKDADCRDPKNNPEFVKRVLEQIRELLTNYGKIDLLWIDYEGEPSPVKPNLIYQLANKLQPGIIINNRLDVLHTDESHSYIGPNGDYATPEGFVAGYGSIPWETCTNLGHQWAWKFNDKPRSVAEAATTLLRCVGGNGNLLLNVGPDSLGQIPVEFEKTLRSLGQWIRPIGKSIYGSKGGPYAPTPDIVSTYNGKSVFLHVLKSDNDTIILPPINIKVLDAKVINGSPIRFYQSKKNLKLILPATQRTDIATTIELTLSKSAECAGIIRPFSTTGSLAYYKKVTASSSVGQFLHDASAAVDDNPKTFWLLGRKDYSDCDKYFGSKVHYINNRQEMNKIFCNSGWLEVDLGKPQIVGRVKLMERVMFKSAIKGFEIQYKKGNQWITWAKDTNMGDWSKDLPPVKARYFRLVILDRDYMSGVREFQLFPPSK
jgi:alpha-L-fucosidase